VASYKKGDLCTRPHRQDMRQGAEERAVKMQGSHVIQSDLRRINLSYLHRLNSLSLSLRLLMLVPHLRSSQTAEIVALSDKNTTSPYRQTEL
jgi:hypothetical protein